MSRKFKTLEQFGLFKKNAPVGTMEIAEMKIQRLNDAITRINKEGLVVRDQKGSVIPHPALKIAEQAEKDLLEIFKTFGERR